MCRTGVCLLQDIRIKHDTHIFLSSCRRRKCEKEGPIRLCKLGPDGPNDRALCVRPMIFSHLSASLCVPAVYLGWADLRLLRFLPDCGINNLRLFNGVREFDSHPGHHSFLLKMNELLDRSFPCTSGVPHFAKERG